jgi:hypothetical protein
VLAHSIVQALQQTASLAVLGRQRPRHPSLEPEPIEVLVVLSDLRNGSVATLPLLSRGTTRGLERARIDLVVPIHGDGRWVSG